MGAALTKPPAPPPGDPPEHGVRVTPGLMEALTGQKQQPQGGAAPSRGPSSSRSQGDSRPIVR